MTVNAKQIKLTPHGHAIVDPDFPAPIAKKMTWRLETKTRNRPRAYSYFREGGKHTKIYLEHFVMNGAPGVYVRFLNSVTLDCRKANLEIVELRRDIAGADLERRWRWRLDEEVKIRTNPQRRRTDAWLWWCEGKGPSYIARFLQSDLRTIKEDIKAMAEDPRAADYVSASSRG